MSEHRSRVLRYAWSLLALGGCFGNSPAGSVPHPASGMAVVEVPEARELHIAKPPAVRRWDTSAVALAEELRERGGIAHIAIKEPGAQRSLETGVRASISRGTIDAALALLRSRNVEILAVYRDIGLVQVRIDGPTAAALFRHPLIDFIEPAQPRFPTALEPRGGQRQHQLQL